MEPVNTNEPIRITRDEALGGHVDDMLKRQMSLKGEGGINRDHGRRFYYQNWFVFMIAGMAAALGAWALLEPYMEDCYYFQGKVTNIDLKSTAAKPHLQGVLTIKGEQIALYANARKLGKGVKNVEAEIDEIKVGDEIGVYVDSREYKKDNSLPIAVFIAGNPSPQVPTEAALTLDEHQRRSQTAGLLLFPLVAGLIGLFVGAADGLVCRLFRRAILAGVVGLLVGFVGGFVSMFIANIVYSPLNEMARNNTTAAGLSTFGFVIQMTGRTIAWGLAGTAMGLGQGIALRSSRLLVYGFLGGVIGGLLGGLVFDPIDVILLGQDKADAHWSRMIGLLVGELAIRQSSCKKRPSL